MQSVVIGLPGDDGAELDTVVRMRCCCHPGAHNWPIPLFSKSERDAKDEAAGLEAERNFKGGDLLMLSEIVKSAVVREHGVEDTVQQGAGDCCRKERRTIS